VTLQDYEPSAFAACALQVAVKHPVRQAGGILDISPTDIDALKAELRSLDLSGVPLFAASLRPRSVHAAVALITDDEVNEKALLVLNCRPLASVFKQVWRRVRTEYPEPRLLDALRTVGNKCDWTDVTRGFPVGDHVRQWCASDRLSDSAAREWSRDYFDPNCTIVQWLETLDIPSGEAFNNAVVQEWLLGTPKRILGHINARGYIALLKQHPKGIRARAMARYLNVLERQEHWQSDILESFMNWFDVPQPEQTQNRYWSRVNEEARKEFRSWALGQRLEEYFDQFADEKGRKQFWRPFMEKAGVEMEHRCPIPGTRKFLAVGLEFRTFGVVEFGQVGNAAYLYPVKTYRKIMTSRSSQVEDYKDIAKTIPIIGSEQTQGRLLHFDGWQDAWAPRITQLIGRK